LCSFCAKPRDADNSPALRLEIRRAKYRRDIAIDLFQEIGSEPPLFSDKATLDDNVNSVANKIRSLLDVKLEKQVTLRDSNAALNFWRDKIEDQGILVFQAPIPLNEMRGFSIWYSPLPIIVVNTNDSPSARVFTMLHELTHLMLRATGLCILNDRDRTEVFCNAVAGAALVPERDFLNEGYIIRHKPNSDLHEAIIKSLAARYKVSREVILRRLLTLGLTTKRFYQTKTAQYEKEYDQKEFDKILHPDSGGPPLHIRTISSAGKTFVRLVVDSYIRIKLI
jgi:Zn-dependent peptidase ImmA (M78 family)